MKLFFQSLPKHYQELDLAVLVNEVCPVTNIQILRDKTLQASTGQAFAVAASQEDGEKIIASLHNALTLPLASHPLQVSACGDEADHACQPQPQSGEALRRQPFRNPPRLSTSLHSPSNPSTSPHSLTTLRNPPPP